MAQSSKRFTKGEAFALADCLATDAIGDFVYVTADEISGRIQVSKVDITDSNKMPAFGVITSKPSTTTCTVQTSGEVSGVYTGMTPQALIFVGSDSRLSELSPDPPPATTYYVQSAGQVLSSTKFMLQLEKIVIKRVGV